MKLIIKNIFLLFFAYIIENSEYFVNNNTGKLIIASMHPITLLNDSSYLLTICRPIPLQGMQQDMHHKNQ